MGADVDLAERTVVLGVAVMGTLVDRTCDCLVGVAATAHLKTPPSSVVGVVYPFSIILCKTQPEF